VQFLNPTVLFGLLAATIPLVLHFLSRRRVTEIQFAPLRFLLPTQEKQMKRMSLRRLLLLLIRMAIIILVVLAVARPMLHSGLPGVAGGGEGASVVLLIDDSASMQAEVSGGTVFDLARREASEIVDALDRSDEVAVIGFASSSRPLFSEFIGNRDLVRSSIADMEFSAEATNYPAALDAAREFFTRAARARHEIYVVGDFQRTALDSMEIARWQQQQAERDPVAVYLRPVQPEPFVNREVAAVERPAALLRAGETTELNVDVGQDGSSDQAVPVFLDVAGVTVAESEARLPAGGFARQGFALTLPVSGDLGTTVRMRPDRYPLDDAMHAVLAVSEQVPVLMLRGIGQLPGEGDPLLFLLASLDPENSGAGRFAPRVELATDFDLAPLATTPVVMLVNPNDLGAARKAGLTEYLESGGTLLLFAGDARIQRYVDSSLLPAWGLPGLGEFRENAQTTDRFVFLAPDHPIFDGFEEEARTTLGEATVENFYRLPDSFGTPLLAWADGGGAVVEAEVGAGRVIVCAFDPSATSGDLVYSPMFLPFMQRLTGYLATTGWGRFAREFNVGDRVIVEAPEGVRAETRFDLVSAEGERRPAEMDASSQPARVRVESVQAPGLYVFVADGVAFATVAVNVDRAESRRAWWTADRFAEVFGGEDSSLRFASLSGGTVGEALATARQGRPLHPLLLWLAGILMVVESFLARRLGPVRSEA
jgi:1,2-phenylacetyl-CoA epoxidase PaaB subunit